MKPCFFTLFPHVSNRGTTAGPVIVFVSSITTQQFNKYVKDWGERQAEKKICTSKNFKLYIKT